MRTRLGHQINLRRQKIKELKMSNHKMQRQLFRVQSFAFSNSEIKRYFILIESSFSRLIYVEQAKSSSKKASDNDENIHGRKQYKSSPAAPRLRTTGESRRPNEPLPEIPLNDHESSAKSSLRNGRGSSQMSNNYEVLHTNNSSSPTTGGMPSMQRQNLIFESILHAPSNLYFL